jgi:hypothetical protein
MPPASSAEREEERRVNMRTLLVASAASAAAAAVTSQLWIAGTWVAAALTPALVALISEAVHRPTERIARAWTSEREVRAPRAASTTRDEPAALSGTAGPVRVYRQSARGGTAAAARPARSRRRVAVRAVAVTAAIAFVIAVAAITTVDLVSGGSVGKGAGRTTFWSGAGAPRSTNGSTEDAGPSGQGSPDAQQDTTPTTPPTTTAPAPEPEPAPSDTAPAPAPAEPPATAPTTP